MRLIFSFLFILSFSFVQSQVVVSATLNNFLYRGLNAQIDIAVSGWDSEDLIISVTGGSYEKLSDGSYSVLPSNNQKVRVVEITVYGGGEAIFLGNKKFRIKNLPDPEPRWCGKFPSDSTITMEKLYYFCPLTAPMVNFDYNVKSRVQSFSLTINTDEGKYTFKSESNRLTSEMENMISKMRKNDTISIQDIFVRLPDGTERTLDPIKLTVDGLR